MIKINKKTLLSITLLTLAVGTALFFWITRPNTTSRNATANNQSSDQLGAIDNNTRKTSQSPSNTLSNGNMKPNSNGPATITVTRAGIVYGNLQVGTLVTNSTSGTCKLSVSQIGQATVTSINQLIQQNNSYVCPVFNVSLDRFPNKGKWNVSVTFTDEGTAVTNDWAENPIDLSGVL